jgi:predicted nucleic acid-binding protein
LKILLDTNVVLRLWDRDAPLRTALERTLERENAAGFIAVVAPQVLYEAWTVLTRSAEQNGLGRDPVVAGTLIRDLYDAYEIPDDPPSLVTAWLDLCVTHGVRGRQGHDARLVAWMELHGVRRLLTLNGGDFARYPQVEVVDLAV